MKIIRHLTPAGPAYAALQPDGTALEIKGDLYGAHTTGGPVKPGKLLAPVVPVNLLGIGLNYRRHAEEGGKGVPERPMLFIKGTNSVQNPGDPIELPRRQASTEVDWECELAVVIGKACKNATKANALDYVLGYTAANDVSARDWQFKWNGGQFCQGKSFDTFCPLGPVLVTKDEIPNPNALRIQTIVNGQPMQDWNTNDMVFDVPTLIEFLSGSKTLLPGTVILTGTPHGVGYARKPPVFLKAGDVVTIDIEQIGVLTNPVVDEAL
jgi:2-keto-4-pentenoate hydratase/2-oxohepta-3-ene-1,7-dioic acid hydratase in catechol pathway